jgi:folate-dependent phosphoribosylglycinamide formyltransferase PurN
MTMTPLYDPLKTGRAMRVAAFISGSGTNVLKLLEKQNELKAREGSAPFEVIFIFSDRADGQCRGEKIAFENSLPYFSYDIRVFHKQRGLQRTVLTPEGLAARREFDQVAARLVRAFEIDVIALGGYMSYTTLSPCINVHPADLSIRSPEGRRKYLGDQAVLDAILAGEKTLKSSTLWTDEGVDTGPLLLVSAPLQVELPEPLKQLAGDKEKMRRIADEHQQRLKQVGDWRIFPLTVEMVARGRLALDEKKKLYVDGKPRPNGYPVEEAKS